MAKMENRLYRFTLCLTNATNEKKTQIETKREKNAKYCAGKILYWRFERLNVKERKACDFWKMYTWYDREYSKSEKYLKFTYGIAGGKYVCREYPIKAEESNMNVHV